MGALKGGVLIWGRGSNLQALINPCRDPVTNARIVLVLSNKAHAAGLARAAEAGIGTAVIDHKSFADRAGFDAHLASGHYKSFDQLVQPWIASKNVRFLQRIED